MTAYGATLKDLYAARRSGQPLDIAKQKDLTARYGRAITRVTALNKDLEKIKGNSSRMYADKAAWENDIRNKQDEVDRANAWLETVVETMKTTGIELVEPPPAAPKTFADTEAFFAKYKLTHPKATPEQAKAAARAAGLPEN